MILVGQYDSPGTRRVAIALYHCGIPFARDTRSIFSDAAAVGKISPLTRIPALVLDDGEVLIDSAAILDHLDDLTRRLAKPDACGEALTRADVMIKTLVWYVQDRMKEVLSPSAHADPIGADVGS